jgi:cytochrome bd-type quinol oxidase subunit 1
MTPDLARWQFALTSVNHFFFVPVTIGLLRAGDDRAGSCR